MSSRVQAPPVNLKERIAALQQRNNGGSHPSQIPVPGNSAPSHGAGLRDKIAKFEKKGGIPVPRGSFGLGAPPTVENGQVKRRGELYGNRIPSVTKPGPSGPSMSRSGSPLPYSRSPSPEANLRHVSLKSHLVDMEENASDQSPPPLSTHLASPPQSPFIAPVDAPLTSVPSASRHNVSFSVALDIARRAEVTQEPPLKDDVRELLLSPLPVLSSPYMEEEAQPSVPPVIVVSSEEAAPSSKDVNGQLESPTTVENLTELLPAEKELKQEEGEGATLTANSTVEQPAMPAPAADPIEDLHTDARAEGGDAAFASKEDAPLKQPLILTISTPRESETLSSPDAQGDLISNPKVNGEKVQASGASQLEESTLDSLTQNDPVTPAPHSPALSVNPLNSGTSEMTMDDAAPSPIPSPVHTPTRDLSFVDTSFTDSLPPTPSHVTTARRVSPTTSRGVPVFLTGQTRRVSVPETGAEAGNDLGSALSHAPTAEPPQLANGPPMSPVWDTVPRDSSKPLTFSAVVHSKVKEMPSSSSQSGVFFNPPTTPQMARVQRTTPAPGPLSPGYGDLAMLMEEAALLEDRLMHGQIAVDTSESPLTVDHPATSIQLRGPPQFAQSIGPIAEESRSPPNSQIESQAKLVPRLSIRTKRRKDHLRVKHSVSTISSAISSPALTSSPSPSPSATSFNLDLGVNLGTSEQGGNAETPPTPPPKSPLPKYLSGIRRFASAGTGTLRNSVSMHMPGAHPRYSVSTSSEISSEDSVPVATPPDNGQDFTESDQPPTISSRMQRIRLGSSASSLSGKGPGIGWPSVSPKKGGSLSRASTRATSFAEKIWHRGRTKSTTSNIDAPGYLTTPSLPPILPSNLEPLFGSASPNPSPPTPTQFVTPPKRGSSLLPSSTSSSRPTSWISTISESTMSSPLFDKSLYDAFPSVPQGVPLAPSDSQRHLFSAGMLQFPPDQRSSISAPDLPHSLQMATQRPPVDQSHTSMSRSGTIGPRHRKNSASKPA